MTITIEGEPISRCPKTVRKIFEKFPSVKKDAAKFVTKPLQTVQDPVSVLYINQKEYATLHKGDSNIKVFGSDDATTCHILFLVNQNEGILSVSHIDSANDKESLSSMVIDVLGSSQTNSSSLDLYIIGGYDDEKNMSTTLTLKLLEFFHKLLVHFELKMMCVGTINTHHREGINWPIVYGVAASFQTEFEISPASFSLNVRGPHIALRSARLFCDKEHLYRYQLWFNLLNKKKQWVNIINYYRVYNSKDGVFVIEPFNYRCPHYVSQLLHKSDDYIRDNFSTSPAVEPPHFSQEIKQVFQFVTQHPFPMFSIFKSKLPMKFTLSSFGEWQELE